MMIDYSHMRPPDRRQRHRQSQQISRPMFSYNNPHSRTVSDRWYRRRAIFIEDTVWSEGLGDEMHVY
jgi:hypothetical protein